LRRRPSKVAELGLFSQVEAYALRELSPSTGTKSHMSTIQDALAPRLMLATVSIVAYAVLVQLSPFVMAIDRVPYLNTAFHLVVGATFGAFVMVPYARAPRRLLRGLLLASAAAAIYYAAIRFVVDGPAGLDALASFAIAGAGAALLCGIAVAAIAPQSFTLRLGALLLVAGVVGGAAFDVKVSYDPNLLLGHAAWQFLTCLALFFGSHSAST
jgi:hypothetical protein